MAISSDHMTGFIVGVGIASLGLYIYKNNQAQVDEWLRRQSINLPFPGFQAKDQSAKSLEELLREKERLEDLIAEREMAEKAKTKAASA
jgi:hypothetical protein